MWDVEFILAVGKASSIVIAMVFIEGIVSSRPNSSSKWIGIILPVIMTFVSVWVYVTWNDFTYFLFVFGPALLCWFIYFICQRSLKNGTAVSLNEEE